jgi:hypothetical protein
MVLQRRVLSANLLRISDLLSVRRSRFDTSYGAVTSGITTHPPTGFALIGQMNILSDFVAVEKRRRYAAGEIPKGRGK